MKLPILLRLAAFPLMLAGCSLFKTEKKHASEEKSLAEGPKLVGRIASVPTDKRFVLIQSYGSWNIEPGTILTTRGLEERSANLLVTGEALGEFAAADVQSGMIEIGDAVYSRHVPKPTATTNQIETAPELPENQHTGPIGNVQKNN